ncbi:MAG: hypothetical protein AAF722_12670 [Cyanobacteria bacterium P01_C01_bin.70]
MSAARGDRSVLVLNLELTILDCPTPALNPVQYRFSGIALQIGMESFGSKGAGEQDV